MLTLSLLIAQITDHATAAKLAAYQLATEAEFIPGRVDIALGMGCLGYIGESLRESEAPEYWGTKVAKALHEVNNTAVKTVCFL